MNNYFCTVSEAIKEVRRGKMLILVDGPERENEADFFIPTESTTTETTLTMIREGGGLLCVAMTGRQAQRLELPLMVALNENTERTGVNFTVSANAREGITTGVSAHDRARTIALLGDPRSRAEDLVKPGHVSGLVARAGGLLEREGHTEAAVDLARCAGKAPAGVLCEIVGVNGHMARGEELLRLSDRLGIAMVTIFDLVQYMRERKTELTPAAPGSN